MSLVLSFNLTDSIPFHFQPSLFWAFSVFDTPVLTPIFQKQKDLCDGKGQALIELLTKLSA